MRMGIHAQVFEHVGTRDKGSIRSHCQKWLIKLLKENKPLPDKVPALPRLALRCLRWMQESHGTIRRHSVIGCPTVAFAWVGLGVAR